MEFITKKEFCEATHTSPNSWLFEHEKEYPIEYGKETAFGETIYHTFQGAEHRKFKVMNKYGEVWHCLSTNNQTVYGMWSTWKVL